MVAIAPFRALRYDPDRVRLSKVTSPPHDVMDREEQAAYRARDGHNIVHIIQPREDDGDAAYPDRPNKYERAAEALAKWQEEGVLARDGRPGLYLYEIRRGEPGQRKTMRGFFARVALDPTYTHIRRHERTLGKKKRDRLNLQEATSCNTESIWLLYRDERGWVDEILTSNAFEELTRFTDGTGAEHALLLVDRPEAVTEIVAQFEDRDVVIADGHHRYQTALDHYANTGREEDASILVCLVRDSDPGLRIEPTHRLVVGLDLAVEEAVAQAEGHWAVAPIELPADDAAAASQVRSLVDADPRTCVVLAGERAWHLVLKDGHEVEEGRGRLDSLVVTRVHERLLGPWGIGEDDIEEHLRFTRDDAEAVRAAREGRAPLVVMLSGEEVEAVLDVAAEGHVMPQKSTYFVPKLRSGLVLGPLDEAPPRDWREMAGDGGRKEFRMPKFG